MVDRRRDRLPLAMGPMKVAQVALLLWAVPAAGAQGGASYDSAIAMISQRQEADDRVAVPEARSILLTRGQPTRRVFVLLHGLTDSPQQFAPLAERLYEGGENVFVPRLPRHGLRGGTARSLAALTREDLRGFADSIAGSAVGLGDSVVVVGLSLGGTIAAWMAQWHPLCRAVLIAPALEPGRIPAVLDRPLVGLLDRLPNVTRRSAPDTARPDLEPGFSTRAAAEIFEFGRTVLHVAARVASPTRSAVVLVNADDRTVRLSAAEALARDWARLGATISVFELPGSLRLPHNIVDPARGPGLDEAVLELLRQLAYGEPPSSLVNAVPLH
jgi:esterase/lipase